MSNINKSKMTPAPWKIEKRTNFYLVDGSEEEKALIIKNNISLRFEAIGIGTDNNGVAIIPLDESNIANAYVIAVAPELREALIATLLHWEKNKYFPNGIYQKNKDVIEKSDPQHRSWKKIREEDENYDE